MVFSKRLLSSLRVTNRSRSISSLASLVHGHAKATPDKFAVLAPNQSVEWTYTEFSQKAKNVASALAQRGLKRGDVLVTDLPNTADNLLLQTACSHLGGSVATVKNAEALAQLCDKVNVHGAVTYTGSASDLLKAADLPVAPIVVEELNGQLGVLEANTDREVCPELVASDVQTPLGYWGSPAALTNKEALDNQGFTAMRRLEVTREDRMLVSITLCHAFGIGTAVGSALLAGACIVLPGASGIRGCGNPQQRAEVTLQLLSELSCTLLFADTHTLKALPSPGYLPLMRGGVCKIGSGSDFLEEVTETKDGVQLHYAGAPLLALGKRS